MRGAGFVREIFCIYMFREARSTSQGRMGREAPKELQSNLMTSDDTIVYLISVTE